MGKCAGKAVFPIVMLGSHALPIIMKTNRLLAAVFAAGVLFAASALAGDPTGTWNWKVTTPNGDQFEISCVLKMEEGKLTGTYHSQFGDAPISYGSFHDEQVAFDVEREFDGNKFVIKYAGRLEGDTITGTITLPAWDGGSPQESEWKATRG